MIKDKRPKKELDIDDYEDPIGLSAKNLKIGLWIANNHKLIWKTTIIILSLIAGSFIIYSSYSYLHYLLVGKKNDISIYNDDSNNINFDTYREQNKIENLKIISNNFTKNNGFYDFIARIKNPNKNAYASLDFCFYYHGKEVCSSTFILPDSEKDVMSLKNDDLGSITDFNFEITKITWEKIDNKVIPVWNDFYNNRFNFTISPVKVVSYSTGYKYLEFSVTNNSTFSYYELPLNIKTSIYSNEYSFDRYIVKDLLSKETKDLRILWNKRISTNSSVEIEADLDIKSEDVYIPYITN